MTRSRTLGVVVGFAAGSLVLEITAQAGVNRWTRETPDWGPEASVSIALCPDVPGCAFVATTEGIYATVDGGSHWRFADLGFADTAISMVALGPSDGRLAFAIAGSAGPFRTENSGAAGPLLGRVFQLLQRTEC